MTDQLKYSILKIIDHDGDLMSIVSKGYEFSQITSFFDNLQQQGMIAFIDNTLSVTAQGTAFIIAYEKSNNLVNDTPLLLRQEFYWCEPLSPEEIYIPK